MLDLEENVAEIRVPRGRGAAELGQGPVDRVRDYLDVNERDLQESLDVAHRILAVLLLGLSVVVDEIEGLLHERLDLAGGVLLEEVGVAFHAGADFRFRVAAFLDGLDVPSKLSEFLAC